MLTVEKKKKYQAEDWAVSGLTIEQSIGLVVEMRVKYIV